MVVSVVGSPLFESEHARHRPARLSHPRRLLPPKSDGCVWGSKCLLASSAGHGKEGETTGGKWVVVASVV